MPLHWEELSDKALKPDRWTIKNIASRLDEGDPWHGMTRHARALPKRETAPSVKPSDAGDAGAYR